MDVWTIAIAVLIAMFGLLAIGIPVSFALAAIAIVGTFFTWGPKGLYMVVSSAFSASTNFIYIAIPLFIIMANLLRSSRLADDMFEVVYRWAGRLKGGLAIGTVVICAVFAAMAGVSSVATVTMSLIALPAMLQRGYNKSLAIGCIVAGGSLGILIPPSVIMILYAAISGDSVGKLFLGGVLPGIVLTLIFIIYIAIYCKLRPEAGPPGTEVYTFREKLVVLKGVILPILLVILVLGAIFSGMATPTEAAGVGAFGAVLCLLVYGKLKWASVRDAALSTVSVNAMIVMIIIGASCFNHFLAFTGVQDKICAAVIDLPLSPWTMVIMMQIVFLMLGMFLDPAGIIMLTGPIFIPIISKLGFDTLWFGILWTINMEMGYLTPPFGFNLFILKGVAPPEITMGQIYRSVTPFVICQAVGLAIVMLYPPLAVWLPNLLITK